VKPLFTRARPIESAHLPGRSKRSRVPYRCHSTANPRLSSAKGDSVPRRTEARR